MCESSLTSVAASQKKSANIPTDERSSPVVGMAPVRGTLRSACCKSVGYVEESDLNQ